MVFGTFGQMVTSLHGFQPIEKHCLSDLFLLPEKGIWGSNWVRVADGDQSERRSQGKDFWSELETSAHRETWGSNLAILESSDCYWERRA